MIINVVGYNLAPSVNLTMYSFFKAPSVFSIRRLASPALNLNLN